jgi:hypothetical protein
MEMQTPMSGSTRREALGLMGMLLAFLGLGLRPLRALAAPAATRKATPIQKRPQVRPPQNSVKRHG